MVQSATTTARKTFTGGISPIGSGILNSNAVCESDSPFAFKKPSCRQLPCQGISNQNFFLGKMTFEQNRSLNAFRARIGMVFQQFNVWPHLNALENVVRAQIVVRKRMRDEAEKKAIKILNAVSYTHLTLPTNREV